MAEGGSTAEKNNENNNYDAGSVEVNDDISNNINIPFNGNTAPDDFNDIKILDPIA